MKCKNCGARLGADETTCPNCGAITDTDSGYTIITADDRVEDLYSNDEKKPHKGLRLLIVLLLVVALAAGGSYLYFHYILPLQQARPELTFTTGTGVINEEEPVVYLKLDNAQDMEFIHGVSLYDGPAEGEPLTTDYQYTKNVDATFRTIFFYTDGLNLTEGQEYNYTFVITVSFHGSDRRYDYEQPVTFSGTITDNAAPIVFDHSMYERADNENYDGAAVSEETTVAETTEAETTTAATADISFIYQGFWYGMPVENGDRQAIDSYQFVDGGAFTVTHYTKEGDEEWTTSMQNGTFKEDGGELTLTLNGETQLINVNGNTLTLTGTGVTDGALTARKYNSVINADDFFNEE